MRILVAALAATVLAWSAPGRADDIDLSTWTCRQFQSTGKDDIDVILAWLDATIRTRTIRR